MTFRIVIRIFLPVFVLLIICASAILHKSINNTLLLITGILFVLSFLLEHKLPRYFYYFIVMFSLGIFHWISHLNWCNTLYLMLCIPPIYRDKGIIKSLSISLFMTLQYTFIRLSYVETSSYNILVSIYDLLTFILVVFVVRYLIQAEREKQSLRAEKKHLLTHDPITCALTYRLRKLQRYKQCPRCAAI